MKLFNINDASTIPRRVPSKVGNVVLHPFQANNHVQKRLEIDIIIDHYRIQSSSSWTRMWSRKSILKCQCLAWFPAASSVSRQRKPRGPSLQNISKMFQVEHISWSDGTTFWPTSSNAWWPSWPEFQQNCGSQGNQVFKRSEYHTLPEDKWMNVFSLPFFSFWYDNSVVFGTILPSYVCFRLMRAKAWNLK